MTEQEQLKQQALAYIDANRDVYLSMGRDFYTHPELAFRENYTSNKLLNLLEPLGMTELARSAHSGVVAKLSLGNPNGKTAGVIAEIDALYLPHHPDADPKTGAAHTCGHHIQSTALAGVAMALKNSGVWQQLKGTACFFACPAEEGNVPEEIYRQLQETEGFATASGKQEMVRRGCFDGVDALLSTHALINDESVTAPALLSAGCNGYNRWIFQLQGKSAHPAMNPSLGINALNCAMLALHALQCVRESLPLDDYSLLLVSLDELEQTPGAIASHATLRVTTKSRSASVLEQLDEKVLNAVRGAALSVGCELSYEKIPGYQSFLADMPLSRIYMDNCAALLGQPVEIRPHGYYSNDLGDVSKVTAVSQIVVGGFSGALHSERFHIDNEDMAYILPAKMMVCTLIDLLS